MRTPKAMPELEEVAPGLVRFTRDNMVVWRGTAQAITEAGLAEPGQFPGMPGNGRTMSSFKADGSKARQGQRTTTGRKTIVALQRSAGTVYEVRVIQPERPSASAGANTRKNALRHVRLPSDAAAEAIDRLLSAKKVLWEAIAGLDSTSPGDCVGVTRIAPSSMRRIKAAQSEMTMAFMNAEWEGV